MSGPIHVVVESRKDYIERQNAEIRFVLQGLWWLAIGYFIGYFVVGSFIPNAPSLYQGIFIAYLVMFFLATYVLKGKNQAYLKIVIAGTYVIIGLLFLYATLYGIAYGKIVPDMFLWFFGIVAFFFYLAYHNLKKYTNLIDWIVRKIKKKL